MRGKTELSWALVGGRFWWPERRRRDIQAEGNRGQSGQCDKNTGLQIRRRVRQMGHLGMFLNSRLSSNLNVQAMRSHLNLGIMRRDKTINSHLQFKILADMYTV